MPFFLVDDFILFFYFFLQLINSLLVFFWPIMREAWVGIF